MGRENLGNWRDYLRLWGAVSASDADGKEEKRGWKTLAAVAASS